MIMYLSKICHSVIFIGQVPLQRYRFIYRIQLLNVIAFLRVQCLMSLLVHSIQDGSDQELRGHLTRISHHRLRKHTFDDQ